MGGIGFSIELEPGPDKQGPQPQELLSLVWNQIEESILKLCNDNSLALAFLGDAYIMYQYESWEASSEELLYTFADMAGCYTLSMTAYYHWSQIAVAHLFEKGIFGEGEFTTLKPPKVGTMEHLWAPTDVLQPLDAPDGDLSLYTTRYHEGQIELGSDEGSYEEWDSLPEHLKQRLLADTLMGNCQCPLCVGLKSLRPSVFREASSSDLVNLPKAFAQLRSDEGKGLVASALFDREQVDWSSPRLLDAHLVLNDWLEERDCRLSERSLIGLLVNQRRHLSAEGY